jgi:hypothetical protein
MQDAGLDLLHELIVEFTPIRTGNLRTSWFTSGSTVKTEVDYAPYVNYGTGLFGPEHRKYLIEPHPPKRFLSWIDPARGGRVFARRVWHPGSEGAHMIEKAAAAMEAGLLTARLQTHLETFKRDMEAQAAKAQERVEIG